jgi:glycosyltransferase involved in cell wall biosynthesis
VVIDTLSFVNPARKGRRKTDRIPIFLRPAALWFMQSRRMALQALEKVRLDTASARLASFAAFLQRSMMGAKYRAIMVKPDGSRRAYVPVRRVIGPPVRLTGRDTLVCAGAGWTHNDIDAIAAEKRAAGFRFVLLCHDIIPLLFPNYYRPHDVEAQRNYCAVAFAVADLVIFGSRTVEADVRAYCGAHGIALGETAVCPFGADVAPRASERALPPGLKAGHYALLVSTIEPRKGHRLIYDVWLELLAAGIPQRAEFKLVFAGREGWMIGDLMRDLRTDPRLAGTLVVITDAQDAEISRLYRDAAFCLYPSRYEGYGLPAIEALFHGKAVLASTGGAIPEVVGGFAPCLDPDDAPAWRRMMGSWIEEPAARAACEERIRTSFRHPDWDDSARNFFALVGAAWCRPEAG